MDQISNALNLIKHVAHLLDNSDTLHLKWQEVAKDVVVKNFISEIVQTPFNDKNLESAALNKNILEVIPVLRRLRTCFSQPSKIFTSYLVELTEILAPEHLAVIDRFNSENLHSQEGNESLSNMLAQGPYRAELIAFTKLLEENNPHALYPTSPYRESTGSVVSAKGDQTVEAAMSHHTFTSIRIEEKIFEPKNFRHDC